MARPGKTLLHFGPGSFGLGFVVPLARTAGLDVVVANRTSPNPESQQRNDALRRNRVYTLDLRSIERSEVSDIRIADFVYLDSSKNTLIDLIAQPSTTILTTALK